MIDYKVDYHIHTTFSDGVLKPVEIVKKRKAEDYDIIAITDHDCIDGLQEALTAGEALELKVVPGIELSTKTDDGIEIHMLGYNFDIENNELIDTINQLKQHRKDRNERLLLTLKKLGYDLSLDEIKERANQTYFGKPHFARALVKKGYATDYQDAFDNILEKPEIKAIKKEKLSTYEAIKLINNAGGMAVIAHPGKIKAFGVAKDSEWQEKMSQLIRDLKAHGLKGIECFHPDHGKFEEDFFIGLANKFHLHMTEGSDFHQ